MFYFQAKAPSRRKLKRNIRKLGKEVLRKITDSMKEGRRVSATVDIWTTKNCKDSFIGVTCHTLNTKTQKRENYRVSCRLMDCPHTGINIAKVMKQIFLEYGIYDKVFKVLSDNASTMIKAVRDMKSLKDGEEDELEYSSDEEAEENVADSEDEKDDDSEPDDIEDDTEVADVEHHARVMETEEDEHAEAFKEAGLKRNPCVVHMLQLPIQKLISSKKTTFGKVLRKCRLIVKKYRKSSKAKVILRKLGFKYILQGFCKTRWWSDVAMVERIVKAAEFEGNAVAKLIDRMEWNIEINDNDVRVLKQYLDIMDPFRVFGDRLGGEITSTVHLIYPMVSELLCHLQDKIRNNIQKNFCQALHREMKKYFKFALDVNSRDFDPFFIIATFLDPFYKGSLDKDMMGEAKQGLMELVQVEMKRENREEVVEEEPNLEEFEGDKEAENSVEEEEEIFQLPGMVMTSKKISSREGVMSKKSDDATIESDIKQYEVKAEQVMENAKQQAKAESMKKKERLRKDGKEIEASNVKMELKTVDPLDFWLRQASSSSSAFIPLSSLH